MTEKQKRFIPIYIKNNMNITKTAAELKVSTMTIHRWINNSDVKIAINDNTKELYAEVMITLLKNGKAAAIELQKILTSNESPPQLKIKVAELILDKIGKYSESDTIENRIDELEKLFDK